MSLPFRKRIAANDAFDEHTMFCFLWWKRGTSAMTLPQPAFKDGTPIRGTGRGNKFLPNTTDWLGRWRLAANTSNDWGMNRAAQRNNAIYSGIDGIHLQDQAITESMGPSSIIRSSISRHRIG